MYFQQLPPEIIHSILYCLPSIDITTMASFDCRSIREWSLELLNERAQESMLQGWRLMLGATIIKPDTGNGIRHEEDKEYVYTFDYIDSKTLDLYFSMDPIEEEEEGCGTPVESPSSASPPPEQHQKPDKPSIPMNVGYNTTTTIQTSILKIKVPTTLLEFAATLSDKYSFLVPADEYASFESNHDISLSADLSSEFTINYNIQRPTPIHEQQDKTTTTTTILSTRPNTSIAPPSPPSQNQSMTFAKPDIVLRIDSIKVAPKWWWNRIDHQHYSSFLGTEHLYW